MSNAQHRIRHLGAMVALQLLADNCSAPTEKSVVFHCEIEKFSDVVTRALTASLRTLPYHDVMEIALELQRRTLQAKGLIAAENYEETESPTV